MRYSVAEICEVNPRLKHRPADDEPVAFVGMADLDEAAALAVGAEVRSYREVAKGYTPFEDGDILLAKITPCFQNSKIGQAKLSTAIGFGSTEFHVLRPREGVVDRRYLLHMLRRDDVRRHGELRMTGAGGQRRVPTRFLEELTLPLPPIEEQRRMAEVLDAADALRAKRREALARARSLRNAVVAEYLEDDLNRVELGGHLDFVTSGSRGWAKYYTESGCRFVRSQDVGLGEMINDDLAFVAPPDGAEARRTRIEDGDLLVTITGTVGRVTAAGPELSGAHISQHVAIARPGATLRPKFAEAFMCSRAGQVQLERAQYGQTKPGLNLTQIREFELPVPSLEEQDSLLNRLAAVDDHTRLLRSSNDGLAALLASLQQRAFRGEL